MFKLTQVTSKLDKTNIFFPGYLEVGIEEKVFLTEKDAEMYLTTQLRNQYKIFYIIEYVIGKA